MASKRISKSASPRKRRGTDAGRVLHIRWAPKDFLFAGTIVREGTRAPDYAQLMELGHKFYLRRVRPLIYSRSAFPAWSLEAATKQFIYHTIEAEARVASRSPEASAIADALLRQATCSAALAGLCKSLANFAAAGHALWQLTRLGISATLTHHADVIEKKRRTEGIARANARVAARLLAEVKKLEAEFIAAGKPARSINKLIADRLKITRQHAGRLRKMNLP